ncbi:hypothetical protein M2317_000016 [Microbacterium sp. ZKA21]|uniref:hypothetical protein n=1 Tax=Microbacterium sp. ZKA21 TaxID=3381694 RepID=UPI003D203C37
MRVFRRSAAMGIALGLIGLGILGLFLTWATWQACTGDPTSELCYATMGQPAHLVPLQIIWLIGIGLATGGFAVARSIVERVLCVCALALVIGMNHLTEYALWLVIVGGHWDVPPGTGYTQAAALVVAGILIAIGALLPSRPERRADDRREALPAA